MRAIIERGIVGQRAQRNVADHFAVEFQHHVPGISHFTDYGKVQLPLAEDRLGHRLLAGLQHHEHPLLAFAQHHFVGRHAFLAAGHEVHVEPDARAALAGHFDRAGSEAGRAHVLDRDDRVGGHQLEAGLDQQLFGEGIAHLHGRALFLALLVEVGAGHGRAVDPVAPGLGADIDDRIADAGGGRIEDLVGIGHAHGHRVDQDVAIIGLVEIGLAANGRHADAVAIAADPRNHALDQAFHLGMIGPAETQRVHVGDGPRAHGEHVAQDAAHAGRRTLIGFDVAGVVVALHLEDGGLAIPDVDDPGILARPADHPGGFGRQLLQVQAARLVRAMLRPHDREDAQLDQVRLTPQGVQHALVFILGQPVLGNDFGSDFGHWRPLASQSA